jgi:hypothetical protein
MSDGIFKPRIEISFFIVPQLIWDKHRRTKLTVIALKAVKHIPPSSMMKRASIIGLNVASRFLINL